MAESKIKSITPNSKHHFIFPDDFETHHEFQYWVSHKKIFGSKSYMRIKDIGKEELIYHIYIPHLAYMFSKNQMQFHVRELKGVRTIKTRPFYLAFKEGYNEGLKYFDENYKVPPSVIYGDNSKIYERTLHQLYFHPKEGNVSGQWVNYERLYPVLITFSEIRKYGYYSGIISSVYELRDKHPIIFQNFKKCIEPKEHKNELHDESNPQYDIILKHLKPLNGKWKMEKIMTEEDFKTLIINTNYLIENSKLPSKISEIKITSSISGDFIRKAFYNLHRELNGKKVKDEWIEFIQQSFSCFSNWEIPTLKKVFSIYRTSYENDLRSITY